MKKNSDTKPLPETPKPNIPPKKRRLKNNYVCRWTIEKTTNKRNKKGFLIFFKTECNCIYSATMGRKLKICPFCDRKIKGNK